MLILTVFAVAVISIGVSSCKKSSSDTPTPVIILDGYYVKGAATAYTDFNDNAMMKAAYNEVLNPVTAASTLRSSLLELYIPVKAGAGGFNIVQVAGSVRKTYGPGSDFAKVTPTTDEPDSIWKGNLTESTNKFTVAQDGLYHVIIDNVLGKVAISWVNWGLIGAATPHGWTGSTAMTASAFNLTSMTWTISNLTLTKGQWKFRYTNGWKIVMDTNEVQTGGKKGVKVNTNFGYKVDSILPGGDNITNSVQGIYTCSFAYTLGKGYKATLTKTADIPPVDYSTYQMGIIGAVYLKLDGTQANWDENFGTSVPVVTGGTTYTWTYNIPINAVGDFKFRQGTDWSGKSIGYGDVTMAGPAAANFSDDGGNFKVSVVGNYTLVLKIDAVTENYTVTATKN